MRTTHGMARTPTYRSWVNMVRRCHAPGRDFHGSYGSRGIAVCDRWRNSFADFLADMGARPDGTTLDRINVDGDYEPGNCRWATTQEQGRNRRDSHWLTYRGVTVTLAEWSERMGIRPDTLGKRLRNGWSIDDALETPARSKAPNGSGRAVRASHEREVRP